MSQPKIVPTVGRVVWFWPWSAAKTYHDPTQPLAAMVTYVHDASHVNLVVFGMDGEPHATPMVYLWHGDSDRPTAGTFCEWMPYQKGQAAKVEQLEKTLKQGYHDV